MVKPVSGKNGLVRRDGHYFKKMVAFSSEKYF
jgi:hypothetical protein